MDRSAAAVAGESEGSGIDLCVVFVTLHHDNDGKPGKTPSRCADEGESGSGADDISRRAAACKREVPGGSVASAARCDGDGGSDPFTGEVGSDAQRGVGGSDRGLSWVLSAVRRYKYRRANNRVLGS